MQQPCLHNLQPHTAPQAEPLVPAPPHVQQLTSADLVPAPDLVAIAATTIAAQVTPAASGPANSGADPTAATAAAAIVARLPPRLPLLQEWPQQRRMSLAVAPSPQLLTWQLQLKQPPLPEGLVPPLSLLQDLPLAVAPAPPL